MLSPEDLDPRIPLFDPSNPRSRASEKLEELQPRLCFSSGSGSGSQLQLVGPFESLRERRVTRTNESETRTQVLTVGKFFNLIP